MLLIEFVFWLMGGLICVSDYATINTPPIETFAFVIVISSTLPSSLSAAVRLPFTTVCAIIMLAYYLPPIMYAVYYKFAEPVFVQRWRHNQYIEACERKRGRIMLSLHHTVVAFTLHLLMNIGVGSVLMSNGWAMFCCWSCLFDLSVCIWVHDVCIRKDEDGRGQLFDSMRWYFWYNVASIDGSRCHSIRWPLLDTLFLSDPPQTKVNWPWDCLPLVWHIRSRHVDINELFGSHDDPASGLDDSDDDEEKQAVVVSVKQRRD